MVRRVKSQRWFIPKAFGMNQRLRGKTMCQRGVLNSVYAGTSLQTCSSYIFVSDESKLAALLTPVRDRLICGSSLET